MQSQRNSFTQLNSILQQNILKSKRNAAQAWVCHKRSAGKRFLYRILLMVTHSNYVLQYKLATAKLIAHWKEQSTMEDSNALSEELRERGGLIRKARWRQKRFAIKGLRLCIVRMWKQSCQQHIQCWHQKLYFANRMQMLQNSNTTGRHRKEITDLCKQHESDMRILGIDSNNKIEKIEREHAEELKNQNSEISKLEREHAEELKSCKSQHEKETAIQLRQSSSLSETVQDLQAELAEAKGSYSALEKQSRQEKAHLEEKHAKETAMLLRNESQTATLAENLQSLQAELAEAKASYSALEKQRRQEKAHLEEKHAKETAMLLRNQT